VEVYGPESSGKTTLVYHVLAHAQRLGGVCAFIDAEHAMDRRCVGPSKQVGFVRHVPDPCALDHARANGQWGHRQAAPGYWISAISL